MNNKREAKYFRGATELTNIGYENVRLAAERYGELTKLAKHGQVPTGRTPEGKRVMADRVIFYKLRPSLHKCDARCTNAKGHNCECSCGGANHGINR